jgi:hypothetical protein
MLSPALEQFEKLVRSKTPELVHLSSARASLNHHRIKKIGGSQATLSVGQVVARQVGQVSCVAEHHAIAM